MVLSHDPLAVSGGCFDSCLHHHALRASRVVIYPLYVNVACARIELPSLSSNLYVPGALPAISTLVWSLLAKLLKSGFETGIVFCQTTDSAPPFNSLTSNTTGCVVPIRAGKLMTYAN